MNADEVKIKAVFDCDERL